MRWGINLRGDLAKLADDELAARLQDSIDRREHTYKNLRCDAGNRWMYQQGFGVPFGRGPFHARIFYKIIGFFYGGSLNRQTLGELYVLDCEIKDLRDELRRRVTVRKSEDRRLT